MEKRIHLCHFRIYTTQFTISNSLLTFNLPKSDGIKNIDSFFTLRAVIFNMFILLRVHSVYICILRFALFKSKKVSVIGCVSLYDNNQ